MCEQLGQEPDPARMPVSLDELPEEVQWAFIVFNHLSDRWEGTTGTYLGKDWSPVKFFLDLYEVEDPKVVVFFIKEIEKAYSDHLADKIDKQRKAAERKANAGKFAHNVKV
jgi:hypothetical protein